MASLLEKVLSAKPKPKSKSAIKIGPHGMMLGKFGELVFASGCNRLGYTVWTTQTEHEFTDMIIGDWKVQVKTKTLNRDGGFNRVSQNDINRMIANKVDFLALVLVPKNPDNLHDHTLFLIPIADVLNHCSITGTMSLGFSLKSPNNFWHWKYKDAYALLNRQKIRACFRYEKVSRKVKVPALA